MSDTAQPEAILSRNVFRAKLMECYENNRADAFNCRIAIERHDQAQRDKIAGLESELSTCMAVAQKYEYQLAALRAENTALTVELTSLGWPKGEYLSAKKQAEQLFNENSTLRAEVERLKEVLRLEAERNAQQLIAADDLNQWLRAKLEAAEGDTKRLDWLESRRQNLNAHYGTSYGWTFIGVHNVNRIYVRDVNTLDLNDTEARGEDIRAAIDAAMQEAEARRGGKTNQ